MVRFVGAVIFSKGIFRTSKGKKKREESRNIEKRVSSIGSKQFPKLELQHEGRKEDIRANLRDIGVGEELLKDLEKKWGIINLEPIPDDLERILDKKSSDKEGGLNKEKLFKVLKNKAPAAIKDFIKKFLK